MRRASAKWTVFLHVLSLAFAFNRVKCCTTGCVKLLPIDLLQYATCNWNSLAVVAHDLPSARRLLGKQINSKTTECERVSSNGSEIE